MAKNITIHKTFSGDQLVTADKTSPAKIGIVTVSDRASAGVYKDLGGPAIHDYFTKHLANAWQPVARVVADEI